MEIRLANNGAVLDLPKGIELNISHTSPLISKTVTYSLPVMLPYSPENRHILHNPERYDRYYKHVAKWDAIVQQGVFQKKASLNILVAGDDGYDSFFQMNESDMYARMTETNLSTCFTTKRTADDFDIPGVFDTPISKLIKYLELVMVGNFPDEDFLLFEAATDKSEDIVSSQRGDVSYNVFRFINELMSVRDRTETTDIYDTDLNGAQYVKLRARDAHAINLDGQDVDVPVGYGISPFLKLSYMLRRIFSYFGYTLKPSLFDTDEEMKAIAILNNTADSIINATINYAQLVPDGTVEDFLNNIRNAFGCEFFVSEDLLSVEIKFWKDILVDIDDTKNYTPYMASRPRMEFVTPKTIKLTFKRSFEFTSVPFDTLSAFERVYGPLTYVPKIGTIAEKGFYLTGNNVFIMEYRPNAASRGTTVYLTRPLFDHYEDIDRLDPEERSCDFEYLPMVSGYRKILHDPGNDDEEYTVEYRRFINLIFTDRRRHMNSILEKQIVSSSGVESTEVSETSGSCPLMMAFHRLNIDSYEVQAYGTAFHYDKAGEEAGTFDLIPGGRTGLFTKFLQPLDSLLRHSFQRIDVLLNLPEREIVAFRMDRPIYLDNQYLLPEQIEYTIGENNIKVHKTLFRTIRHYADSAE